MDQRSAFHGPKDRLTRPSLAEVSSWAHIPLVKGWAAAFVGPLEILAAHGVEGPRGAAEGPGRAELTIDWTAGVVSGGAGKGA